MTRRSPRAPGRTAKASTCSPEPHSHPHAQQMPNSLGSMGTWCRAHIRWGQTDRSMLRRKEPKGLWGQETSRGNVGSASETAGTEALRLRCRCVQGGEERAMAGAEGAQEGRAGEGAAPAQRTVGRTASRCWRACCAPGTTLRRDTAPFLLCPMPAPAQCPLFLSSLRFLCSFHPTSKPHPVLIPVLGQVILGSNHLSLRVSPRAQGPGLKPSGSCPSDPRAPRPGCGAVEGLWSGPGGFRLTLSWGLMLPGPSPLSDKSRLWALFHLRWEKAVAGGLDVHDLIRSVTAHHHRAPWSPG